MLLQISETDQITCMRRRYSQNGSVDFIQRTDKVGLSWISSVFEQCLCSTYLPQQADVDDTTYIAAAAVGVAALSTRRRRWAIMDWAAVSIYVAIKQHTIV